MEMEPGKPKLMVGWVHIVLLAILALLVVGSCSGWYYKKERDAVLAQRRQAEALAKQSAEAEARMNAVFAAMSPQEHLDEARRLGTTSRADDHLRAVPEEFPGKHKYLMELQARAERDKRQELAGLKKQGVAVGMTAERVLLSSWGRPERVNKTTTINGTREQWVYSSGNYLYFENGILTSIQH